AWKRYVLCFRLTAVFPSWTSRVRSPSPAPSFQQLRETGHHIANEGQFLAVVAAEYADAGLLALTQTPGRQDARILGEVRPEPSATVLVTTAFGGSRVVDMLVGDPLPRIC